MGTKSNDTISIITKPIKVDVKQGHFTLNNNTVIVTVPNLIKIAEYLKQAGAK